MVVGTARIGGGEEPACSCAWLSACSQQHLGHEGSCCLSTIRVLSKDDAHNGRTLQEVASKLKSIKFCKLPKGCRIQQYVATAGSL